MRHHLGSLIFRGRHSPGANRMNTIRVTTAGSISAVVREPLFHCPRQRPVVNEDSLLPAMVASVRSPSPATIHREGAENLAHADSSEKAISNQRSKPVVSNVLGLGRQGMPPRANGSVDWTTRLKILIALQRGDEANVLQRDLECLGHRVQQCSERRKHWTRYANGSQI